MLQFLKNHGSLTMPMIFKWDHTQSKERSPTKHHSKPGLQGNSRFLQFEMKELHYFNFLLIKHYHSFFSNEIFKVRICKFLGCLIENWKTEWYNQDCFNFCLNKQLDGVIWFT